MSVSAHVPSNTASGKSTGAKRTVSNLLISRVDGERQDESERKADRTFIFIVM